MSAVVQQDSAEMLSPASFWTQTYGEANPLLGQVVIVGSARANDPDPWLGSVVTE